MSLRQVQFENFENIKSDHNHEILEQVHIHFFIYNLLNKITPLLCFHSKFHIAPITYSIYAFVIDQSQT